MQVRHRLPGGGPIVDADVVARGTELAVEIITGRREQRHQVGTLCVRDLEERGRVPPGDDERVAGRDREAVADGKCGLPLMEDAIARQAAEGAGGSHGRWSPVAWAQAAPNSTLENLYGPTELTVACAHYRWDRQVAAAESEMGIVPIGHPYPGMRALVAGEGMAEVKPGAEGELLMSGPQMTAGYWMDQERTAAAFVVPPGSEDVYYRTGDRVRRPVGDGPLKYLGRVDHQVKVLGHRVELGEIEAVVREESGLDGVVAVGWPLIETGCGGVEVFIEGSAGDDTGEDQAASGESALRKKLARRLPDYMVPKRYHFMEKLPLNVNGKYDRAALIKTLLQDG